MTTDVSPAPTPTPPTPPPSIGTLEARLNDAARRFQVGKRALFRTDGAPVYADHAQRLAALQAEADQTFRDVQEQARLLANAARAEAEREGRAEPIDKLTSDELDSANRRREFVKEDCERLPLPDLVARVRDALDRKGRAEVALWLRYVAPRLADLETRPQSIRVEDAKAAGELRDLLAEGRGRFVNRAAIERAEAREKEAAELHLAALLRHRDETDAGMLDQERLRARYRM